MSTPGRAWQGGPKGIPKVGPHVCPRLPKKEAPGGTPRIDLGAPHGRTRPEQTVNLTTVVEFAHQKGAGQNPPWEIQDSDAIFRVPPGVPPGALIMTFWVLKLGLLFEAFELPQGARK